MGLVVDWGMVRDTGQMLLGPSFEGDDLVLHERIEGVRCNGDLWESSTGTNPVLQSDSVEDLGEIEVHCSRSVRCHEAKRSRSLQLDLCSRVV